MPTLEEIEQKEEELKKQKLFAMMERHYNWCKTHYSDEGEDAVINKFLGSAHGVDWDSILWFMHTQREKYPEKVERLEALLELYKTKRYPLMEMESARFYVSQLEPMGFKISINKEYSSCRCFSCGMKSDGFMLSLLKDYTTGYDARTYRLVRDIRPDHLSEIVIRVNETDIGAYLQTICVTADTIDSVKDELGYLEKLLNGGGYIRGRYGRKWICDECASEPNLDNIKIYLSDEEKKYVKNEWIIIEKMNIVTDDDEVVDRLTKSA